jgi:hypothetical protein
MNKKLIFLILLCMIESIITSAVADDKPSPAPVSWENHSEGVALALSLVSSKGRSQGEEDGIQVLVKNTSTSQLYFAFSSHDKGCRIFYVDSQGARIPIHEGPQNKDIPPTTSATIPPLPLSPGQILTEVVELRTPNELALVRAHPVFCRLRVSENEIGGYKIIESTPKILSAP